jgi:hypothetical protein
VRPPPGCSLFVSMPLDTTVLLLCSLWNNDIGDQGAIALAAVLKESKITSLGCALASNRGSRL